VGERPLIVASKFRRAVSDGGKLLQLSREGVLTFVADAQNLLCWGTSTTQGPLRINVLALAETTYLFAEMANRITSYLAPSPETWRYVIAFQRMRLNNSLAILPRGALRSFWGERPFSDEDLHFDLWLDVRTDPRIVAYKLRLEMYVSTGLDGDEIPYVSEINGAIGTDPEQIKVTGG
jgi:hypothetical protein